jgi:ABC-type sulfate transport system substrate-binding protein
MDKKWDVEVLHVYREGNVAADWLANFVLNKSPFYRLSTYITANPYNMDLCTILYYDLIMSTLPHLI